MGHQACSYRNLVDVGVEIGDLIDGRYRVESALAKGGMGAVYVAHDNKFNTRVALKATLSAGGPQYEQFRARFRREAEIGNHLGRSPGFVRALDWGELPEQQLYLTMDLVEGGQPLDLRLGPLSQRLEWYRDPRRW